jgi:FtsP/CotA-like multicopper oxidase with cupredoxin domain
MNRRQFLAAAGAWTCAAAADSLAQGVQPNEPADATLRIAETTLDLGPKRTIRTLAYNGQVPGPLLRVRRGQRFVVDVVNETNARDIVHWHGLHIPADVDGAYDEGTPAVPPRGRQRYAFVVEPSGTRWYHSHDMPMRDLTKGTYTGQFGMIVVDDGTDTGAYDVEVPLLLHEWEPRFTRSGPLDVEFRTGSINGKMLGYGEPVRVRSGQRALLRIVNASATLAHRLALTGHTFRVVALDGNAVPRPATTRVIEIAPGERVDAIVEMNNPGVWVLGDTSNEQRAAGLGIVIEYAGQSGDPRWSPPGPFPWDYTAFASADAAPEPDERLTLVFKAKDDGHHWMINGQSWPKIDPIVVRAGRRYRWTLDNQSANDHPIHLHRHTFEVVRFAGKPISKLMKDVVVVPAWRQVEIDVRADNAGPSLFHCHQQFHMDMGFMAILRYGA